MCLKKENNDLLIRGKTVYVKPLSILLMDGHCGFERIRAGKRYVAS